MLTVLPSDGVRAKAVPVPPAVSYPCKHHQNRVPSETTMRSAVGDNTLGAAVPSNEDVVDVSTVLLEKTTATVLDAAVDKTDPAGTL